jgi:hypothetical protein
MANTETFTSRPKPPRFGDRDERRDSVEFVCHWKEM